MNRRLVVLDDADLRWLSKARAVHRAGDRWDLLVIGRNAAALEQRCGGAVATIGATFLDQAACALAAHESVCAFVREAIPPLAAAVDESDEPVFWFTELAERSPLRGKLVQRLYRLAHVAAAVREHDYEEVWVAVRDAALQRSIADAIPGTVVLRPRRTPVWPLARMTARYVATAMLALARVVAVRATLAVARAGDLPPAAAPVIYTSYPDWWLRPYETSRMERFFPPSAVAAGFIYFAWIGRTRRVWRNRRALARIFEESQITPIQRWLTAADILALLSPRRFLSVLSAARRLRRTVAPATFERFPVGRLIEDEALSSLSSTDLQSTRLIFRAARRYAHQRSPAAVVYRAEFQPWENALLSAFDGQALRAGFVHAPYGRFNIPLGFARGEIAEASSLGGPSRRPLPDRLLVSGDHTRQHLLDQGFAADRVVACGPQRFEQFLRYLQRRPSRAAARRQVELPAAAHVVFVALAVIRDDTEALFAALARVVPELGDCLLVIKTHPNVPAGDSAMHAALRDLPREQWRIVPQSANMYDYLAASDVMVCIGSTVVFEAMALDVMPIVFENPSTFNVTSMVEFTSGLSIVRNARELADALSSARGGDGRSVSYRATWRSWLRRVYGDTETPLDRQLVAALAATQKAEVRRAVVVH